MADNFYNRNSHSNIDCEHLITFVKVRLRLFSVLTGNPPKLFRYKFTHLFCNIQKTFRAANVEAYNEELCVFIT